MVSAYHKGVESTDWIGLSSETKPAQTPDGSTYLEVDTDMYYIKYGDTWYKYTPYLKLEGRY